MALARDPETGEYLYWTGSDWIAAKLAEDPDTKERLAWDGSTWKSLGKTPSGFGAALSSGVDTLQQALYSAGEGGAKSLGLEGLAKFAGEGAARNKAEALKALPNQQSFSEAESLGDYFQAAKEGLGTSLPQMAPAVVAGALSGGALGSLGGPLGTGIGAVIGGAAAGIPQFYGYNRERQKEESGAVQSEGAALLAAVPQAAMDSLLGKLFPGAGRAVTGGLLTRVVKKGAMGTAIEVLTEVGQQLLERFQAGLPIDDEQALAEYKEAAIAAGVLGGGLGGASGAFQKRAMSSDELARLAGRTEDDQLAQNIEDARAGLTPTPPPAVVDPAATAAPDVTVPPGAALAPTAAAPDTTVAPVAPIVAPDLSATAPEPAPAAAANVAQKAPPTFSPSGATILTYTPEQFETYVETLPSNVPIDAIELAKNMGADPNAVRDMLDDHPRMTRQKRRGIYVKDMEMPPVPDLPSLDPVTAPETVEAAPAVDPAAAEAVAEPAVEQEEALEVSTEPAPTLRKGTAEDIRQKIAAMPLGASLKPNIIAEQLKAEGVSVLSKTVADVGQTMGKQGFLGRPNARVSLSRTAKPYVSAAEAKAAKAAAAQPATPAAIEPSSEEVVDPADFAPAQPEPVASPVANPLPAERRAAAQARTDAQEAATTPAEKRAATASATRPPPVPPNKIADVANQYIANMAPGDRVKADELARELNANTMSLLDAFEANPNVTKGDMFYFTKVEEQAAPAVEAVPQKVQDEVVAAPVNPLPAERRAAAKAKTTAQKAAKTPAQKRAAAAAPVVTPAPIVTPAPAAETVPATETVEREPEKTGPATKKGSGNRVGSLKEINKAIEKAGIPLELEHERNSGYHYFIYDNMNVDGAYGTAKVLVPYLHDYTINGWVEQARNMFPDLLEEANSRRPKTKTESGPIVRLTTNAAPKPSEATAPETVLEVEEQPAAPAVDQKETKKKEALKRIEGLYKDDGTLSVNGKEVIGIVDEFQSNDVISKENADAIKEIIRKEPLKTGTEKAVSALDRVVARGELSVRKTVAPEAVAETTVETEEKTKKKRTKRRKGKGKKKSAAAPKTEEAVEPPTPKTPEEIAAIEERRVAAQKFLDERLTQMEASGPFGQKAAAAVREVLANGDISHVQAHHAFMMAEISSKLLKGTGANPDIKFLNNVDYNGRRLRKGSPDALAGLIEFSLNDNPEKNILGYSKETAAHEPFHVLQDLMEEYDPATSKILFGTRTGIDPETGHGIYKGGAFRDGMTPKDIPSSIRRTLEALSPDASGESYWSKFTQDYNKAPETPALDADGNPIPNLRTEFGKQREAMAYIFGMLADAKSRGFNTNAMDAPFKRFLRFLTQFREKMGNFLRGRGYESTDQVLEDYISGERQQGYGGEVDRTGKSEYSYVGKGAKNWSRETQARAEALEEQGETPDMIYFETGLHRGLRDGEWRAEVFDTDASLERDGLELMAKGRKVGLQDAFDHPDLYDNYPGLVRDQIVAKDIQSGKAFVTPVRGAEFRYNVIEVSKTDVRAALDGDPDTLLDAIVHEVQHIIQGREGFSPGAESTKSLKAKVGQQIRDAVGNLTDDVVYSVKPNVAATPEVAAVMQQFKKDVASRVAKWEAAFKKDTTDPKTMYLGEPGEREGRSTEARRKMSAGELRATLPDAISGNYPYAAEGSLSSVLSDPAYRNRWKKLLREAAAKATPARTEGEFSVRGGRLSKDAELAIRSAQAQSTGRNLTTSNRIMNTLKKAFDPLALIQDRKRYMIMRYLAMGNDTALQEEAKGFYDKISALPKAQQDTIYKYLTTRGAIAPNLPPDVKKLAIDVKTRINSIGDRMAQRGMISKESLAEYKDQYLPRIYMKYLMEGKLMAGTGLRAGPQGQLKQRKDFSEQDRVAMGEVTNPGFLSYMALYRPERDMVMLDFLNSIANASDVDWVWPQSLINYKGMKVTSFWLVDEATAIRQRMKLEPDDKKRAEMKKIAKEMQDLADPHIGELAPENYKQLPKSARYGALKGMVVRSEIYDDIVGAAEINPDANFIDRTFGDKNSTLAKGTAFWKMTKTILNPPTQVRNFISNAVMLSLSGVSPFMVGPRILQAIKQMRANGPAWQIAKKYGVQGAGFGDNELSIAQDIMEEFLANNKTGIMNPAIIGRVFATIATEAGNAYQWSEHVFKTAKIIDELEKNKVSSIRDKATRERAEGEAALEGHKWFFDYSLVPPSIKSLRTMPFGAPFITYYYKALPLIVEVLSNPRTAMRFAPYIALQMAMPAMVASMYDADDEDVDKIKMALSEHLRENGSINIVPFKDQNGNWQFLDWGYFFPWQMFVKTGKALATGDVAGALGSVGALSSPALSAVTAIKTNIDPFSGREIINKADPPNEQMTSFLKYIAQLALPPFVTSTGAVGKAYETLTNSGVNKYGEPNQDGIQIAARLFGFNFYPVVPEMQRARNIGVMQRDLNDVIGRMNMVASDQSIPEDEREPKLESYREEIEERAAALTKYAEDSDVPGFLLEKEE